MVKRLDLDDYYELLEKISKIVNSQPQVVIDAEGVARTEEFRKNLARLERLMNQVFADCAPLGYFRETVHTDIIRSDFNAQN